MPLHISMNHSTMNHGHKVWRASEPCRTGQVRPPVAGRRRAGGDAAGQGRLLGFAGAGARPAERERTVLVNGMTGGLLWGVGCEDQMLRRRKGEKAWTAARRFSLAYDIAGYPPIASRLCADHAASLGMDWYDPLARLAEPMLKASFETLKSPQREDPGRARLPCPQPNACALRRRAGAGRRARVHAARRGGRLQLGRGAPTTTTWPKACRSRSVAMPKAANFGKA